MPIPKPYKGEDKEDFVSRCIAQIYDEYGQEQSAAICYSQYDVDMTSILKQAKKFMIKNQVESTIIDMARKMKH